MSYLLYAAIAAAALALGAALGAGLALRRAGRALRLIEALTPDSRRLLAGWKALAPEEAAAELAAYLETVGHKLHDHDQRLRDLDGRLGLAVTRTGMARFDTSEEVKGKLSFCLALLDEHDDGYLLTSLYTLQSARIFLREVRRGQCDHEMLPEETEALTRARQVRPAGQ